MMNLNRRLEKLEATRARAKGPLSFNDLFAAIERFMLPRLSAADRGVWRKETAPDRQDPVWDRLSEAFSRSAIEARVPFVMCLEDRWGQW